MMRGAAAKTVGCMYAASLLQWALPGELASFRKKAAARALFAEPIVFCSLKVRDYVSMMAYFGLG